MSTNYTVRELEPFYFGDSNNALYGCFHVPATERRRVAAVLCPPLGDEAIRIHRAYKQIASRLSRVGFPVLRFDYFGWGDSAGEDFEATIPRWETDTAQAIEEVKRRSGVGKVVLIGLRLGGTLALQVALQRKDVAGVVLWEAVTNGQDYLQMMEEAHLSKLSYFLSDPMHVSRLSDGMTEVLGFVLSSTMRAQIQAMDVFNFAYSSEFNDVLIVERVATEAASQLTEHLERQSYQVNYQCVDDPAIWGEDPDKALIPAQTLKAITSWFNEKFL